MTWRGVAWRGEAWRGVAHVELASTTSRVHEYNYSKVCREYILVYSITIGVGIIDEQKCVYEQSGADHKEA